MFRYVSAKKAAGWGVLTLSCLAFLSPLRAMAEDGSAVSKDGVAIAYSVYRDPYITRPVKSGVSFLNYYPPLVRWRVNPATKIGEA